MAVYRIRDESGVLGVIASRNKDAAQAYAQGKYGAGADVERVAIRQTLEGVPVCEIVSTRLRYTGDLIAGSSIRVIE